MVISVNLHLTRGHYISVTGISLVVAVVMVIIVQYMSVAERTREIGIMRAIGAKKRDVRNIFLLEAALIGAFAGGIGAYAAWTLGQGINEAIFEIASANAFELFLTDKMTLFGCVAVCIMLCLLAGYFPAKQAASVETIEVLR